jgi:hypothetical protein
MKGKGKTLMTRSVHRIGTEKILNGLI